MKIKHVTATLKIQVEFLFFHSQITVSAGDYRA